jgi:ATP-dependent Clp protease protease subunit
MEKAIETLGEVKESIINAYAAKSGMRRRKIADLMSNETWMNAKKAVEMGFADEILYDGKKPSEEDVGEKPESADGPVLEARMYSSRMMDQAILNRLQVNNTVEEDATPTEPVIGLDGTTKDGAVPYQILMKQLDFLK